MDKIQLYLCYKCKAILEKAGYSLKNDFRPQSDRCDNCRKKYRSDSYIVVKEKK